MNNLNNIKHSLEWKRLFEEKALKEPELPWDEDYILSKEERNCVSSSIQQFELGENSAGKTLLSFALSYAKKHGDYFYPDAIKAFVREEQGHSALIRRFMLKNGIRCAKKHWVNTIFRKIRKLAGLELSVLVLVSAEIIACPYYRALGRATKSKLLYKICRRIQSDERQHLYFQAQMLMKLRRHSPWVLKYPKNLLHKILLLSTLLVVWKYHKKVFKAGGFSFRNFMNASFTRLSLVQRLADPGRKKNEATDLSMTKGERVNV